MFKRLLTALLLVPALAACGSSGVTPGGGGVPAPASQVSGQVAGAAAITRVQAVLQGSAAVRSADIPVTNGAFTYALPTDSSVTSLAAAITPSTFGTGCAGSSRTVSDPTVRVVQLAYFDAYSGSAAQGHLEGATFGGSTVTIHVWVYATSAVHLSETDSCTVNGFAFQDTLDLQLLTGWNSVVGTTTTAADGSVTSRYLTQPVGSVSFIQAGS